jgi:hypothetical protein
MRYKRVSGRVYYLGDVDMCDYSLCGLPNRLAIEGEELVTHRFRTGSIGLASAPELLAEAQLANIRGPDPTRTVSAICIAPGTRLLIRRSPPAFVAESGAHSEEEVVFGQLHADVNRYRDAVQFRDGRKLLLQEIPVGTHMEVLSISSQERSLFEREILATQV